MYDMHESGGGSRGPPPPLGFVEYKDERSKVTKNDLGTHPPSGIYEI
jgi:hypothetical protein